MTIYKLLELLKKVENGDIYKPSLSALKDFTDEEIDLILSSNNQDEVKILIKNTDFKSLPNEIQKYIIEIIGNYNRNAPGLYYAIDVATNKNAINSGYIKELVEIIVKLEDLAKISMVSSIAKDSIATSHKDMLKMIQMFVESGQNTEVLIWAEMLMKSEFAIRTGNIYKTFTDILNSQNEKEAAKIYESKYLEGLSKSLLNVLDEEKIDSINFWNLLKEDYEMALKVLCVTKYPKSFLIESKLLTEQEYDELVNKYFLENIKEPYSQTNEELSPNIRIRRK